MGLVETKRESEKKEAEGRVVPTEWQAERMDKLLVTSSASGEYLAVKLLLRRRRGRD